MRPKFRKGDKVSIFAARYRNKALKGTIIHGWKTDHESHSYVIRLDTGGYLKESHYRDRYFIGHIVADEMHLEKVTK